MIGPHAERTLALYDEVLATSRARARRWRACEPRCSGRDHRRRPGGAGERAGCAAAPATASSRPTRPAAHGEGRGRPAPRRSRSGGGRRRGAVPHVAPRRAARRRRLGVPVLGAPAVRVVRRVHFTVWLPLQFGQVQQYSVYWLLAMVMVVTRSAVGDLRARRGGPRARHARGRLRPRRTGSTRHRLAAAVAATLYAFSPFAISQWLDGHLDVQVAIALGPLAIWMVLVVLRTGSAAAAIALGLCASALFLLTTGEAAYWLLPGGPVIGSSSAGDALHAARARRRAAARARRRARGTFVVASAVQLLPLAAGAKAPFLNTSANYYVESLAVHEKYSLSFLSNVLGVPRESWLPASINLACASRSTRCGGRCSSSRCSPSRSRRCKTRFRSLAARAARPRARLVAARERAGWTGGGRVPGHLRHGAVLPVPPRAEPVADGVHVRRRGERGARRHPLCGAVTAPLHARMRAARTRGASRVAALPWRSSRACVGLACVSAGGILPRGLPTRAPSGRLRRGILVAALGPERLAGADDPLLPGVDAVGRRGPAARRLRDDPERPRRRELATGSATTSSGRGGWDPRAAQFAAYLYDMVSRARTRARRPARCGDRQVRGHRPAGGRRGGRAGRTTSSCASATSSVRVRDGRYTILQNRLAQPIAYVTPTFCVVAGGLQVLGDLTQDPAFHFARTGLVFADQAVATGGAGALRRLVARAPAASSRRPAAPRRSTCCCTRPRRPRSSRRSRPGAWPRVPVNPVLDVAADPAIAVLLPAGARRSPGGPATWRRAPRGACWVRALLGPNEGARRGARRRACRPARSTWRGPRCSATSGSPPASSSLAAGATPSSCAASGAPADVQVVEAAVVAGASTAWRAPRRRASASLRDVNFLSPSL